MALQDSTYLEKLAKKVLAGAGDPVATKAELDILLDCLNSEQGDELECILNKLLGLEVSETDAGLHKEQLGRLLQGYSDIPVKYNHIVDQVLKTDKIVAGPEAPPEKPVTGTRRYWVRAAVILFLCGLSALIVMTVQKDSRSSVRDFSRLNTVGSVIVPGKDKAMLTLSDGRQILLDSAGNGVLADQNGVDVHKVQNGQLIYTQNEEEPAVLAGHKMTYNSMQTPRGGKYQLVLPDGTKVWLNADTRIKYPTRFDGKERLVSMEGEAYFEVAKDPRHPFIVQTSRGLNVRVLGTHFNISDYPDQDAVRTTLQEGSVRVIHNRDSLMIVPGQQAVMASDGHLSKKSDIDLDEITGWKNGLFYFNQMDIASIMQALSRWYDIDVHYNGCPPSDLFSAIMNRDNDIREILSMLAATEKVHFRITGRTVEVTSVNNSP